MARGQGSRIDDGRMVTGAGTDTATGRNAMHAKNDLWRSGAPKPIRDSKPASSGVQVVPTSTSAIQSTQGPNVQPDDRGGDVETIGQIVGRHYGQHMASYPTTYRGVEFRSRLEARWACMFDQLGWSWNYEPFDTPGWIPDFELEGRVLVEVKPFSFAEQWKSDFTDGGGNRSTSVWNQITGAMASISLRRDVLLLGSQIFPGDETYENHKLGWVISEWNDPAADYDPRCLQLDGVRLYDIKGVFDCSPEEGAWGSLLGKADVHKWYHYSTDYAVIDEKWANATNTVKWRASR